MSRDHPQGWFWTCGHCGKRAFPNRRSAKAAARQVRRTQGHDGPPTSVYRCSGDKQAFHWGHDGARAVAILEEERVARTGSKRAASPTRAPRHVALHEPRPERAAGGPADEPTRKATP